MANGIRESMAKSCISNLCTFHSFTIEWFAWCFLSSGVVSRHWAGAINVRISIKEHRLWIWVFRFEFVFSFSNQTGCWRPQMPTVLNQWINAFTCVFSFNGRPCVDLHILNPFTTRGRQFRACLITFCIGSRFRGWLTFSLIRWCKVSRLFNGQCSRMTIRFATKWREIRIENIDRLEWLRWIKRCVANNTYGRLTFCDCFGVMSTDGPSALAETTGVWGCSSTFATSISHG